MTFLQCITWLVTDLKSKFAAKTHAHAASDITSGTLSVARGGTGGSTALDARKNLSVPVDSSIAYVESTTATKNHAVGDYFMLGSVLMKATAAIATGETINASKATAVTVQSQIDTLRDSVLQIHSLTNPFTFASGYSGDTVARYAGLLKSINFKITPSSRLTVGTKYSVGTVASELVPRVHTSVFALCNNDYVYVDITVEGRVEVTPKSGDVNAGTNIWIRHMYM